MRQMKNPTKTTPARLMIMVGLLAFSFCGPDSFAQKPGAPPPNQKKDSSDTFKLVVAKFALGKVVKGAPYAATSVTETTQTLSDGNQIVSKSESKVYRDSEGRTRNEASINKIGKWNAEGSAPRVIFLNDPTTGFSYSLYPDTRTADKYSITSSALMFDRKISGVGKPGAPVKAKPGQLGDDSPGSSSASWLKAKPGIAKDPTTPANPSGADERKKTESLEKQIIEGVEVDHTRVTTTIPIGVIGNTLPIEIVEETWYSPELQMIIMTKRRDPRSGERTYRLTNISRSEPDRSLFEIPSDYTVKDESELKMKPVQKPLED
jgi:hypothetical protein